MGTVVSFDVPGWAGGGGDPALDRAVRWLHWVDATFSPYRDDSDVSRYGRGLVTLAECAPELARVLDACAEVSARSGGYFTTTPGGRFDPSGYVKGWAIERAAAILTAAGSAEHSVNGGGDVQCVGDHGAGQPWRVGIADPLHPGSLALVVEGRDLAGRDLAGPDLAVPDLAGRDLAGRDVAGRGFAVATSGVAERGPHIINPHTGRPATGLASITLVGAGLAETDAYATAAFAMGPAARDWVESLDGYEAFAITPVGATWQTGGFGAYVG
jgi:FAD:protein FMN transferase